MTQFKITIESNDGHNIATWCNEIEDVLATDFFLDLCHRIKGDIRLVQALWNTTKEDNGS